MREHDGAAVQMPRGASEVTALGVKPKAPRGRASASGQGEEPRVREAEGVTEGSHNRRLPTWQEASRE
jgi:hypothetical protein